MNEFSWSIVNEVVGGVLASAIVAVVVLAFYKIALPWYRDHVYTGVEIAGKWTNTMELEGTRQHLQADLEQRGHSVTGTVTVTKTIENQTTASTSTLAAELTDRLLVGTFRAVDKNRIGPVAVLLEVIGGGGVMRGCVAWYDSGDAVVRCGDVRWYRDGVLLVENAAVAPQVVGEQPGTWVTK